MTDRHRVQVHAPDPLRPLVGDALAAAGLRTGDRRPDAGLLLSTGVPPPAAADDWLVGTVPHVVVAVTSSTLRLGPFVRPGTTACLRCLEVEPDETARAVPGGPPPADRVLLGVALAVHELGQWLAGRVPASWSATLQVDHELATWPRRWQRNPWCGCGWGEELLRA
jgi:hypothetical protein